MRFQNLLRLGHSADAVVHADAAMQISGHKSCNTADEASSTDTAAIQTLKQPATADDVRLTEADKIAAAVDLAISLEDG